MPLRALVDGREVQVWDLARDEWSVLRCRGRTNASTVAMACCGASGLAKTSRNGNPFFAHRPVGRSPTGAAPTCRWAGESAAHAVCKLLAAAGAQAAGWDVRTEAAAQNRTWRADVLCARGAARVALEIQLARTVPGEIVARQDRYREAGIRGAWFVPTSLCPAPSRELPAFPLEVVNGMARSAPSVGPAGALETAMRLDAFVTYLLRGRTHFEEAYVVRPLSCPVLVTAPDRCRRCDGPFAHVVGVTNHHPTTSRPRYRIGGAPTFPLRDLWEADRRQARALANGVSRLRRHDISLSPLGPRRCPAVGETYLTALCPSCGTAQGDGAVDRLLTSLHPHVPVRVPIPLVPLTFRPLDGRQPRPSMGDWLERVVPARWRLELDGVAGRPEPGPRQPVALWGTDGAAISARHDGGTDLRLSA
jgi:hypothetical protein